MYVGLGRWEKMIPAESSFLYQNQKIDDIIEINDQNSCEKSC